MRKLIFFLVLLLAGCGGSSDVTVPAALPAPPASQAQLTVAQGGQVRVGETTLTVPAGALSQDATVSLTQQHTSRLDPADDGYDVVGSEYSIQLGGAELVAPAEVMLPASPQTIGRDFPCAVVDGLFIPLESHSDGQGNLVASLDIDPADVARLQSPGERRARTDQQYSVVMVRGQARAAHQPWGSYNAYYFKAGRFEQVVALGQLIPSALPDLGANPGLVIHGFGSNIRSQGFAPLAQSMLDQQVCTGVVGFEYDSLDGIENNGRYLRDFYALLARTQPGKRWRHMAHSMGTLVSREALEAGTLPVAATANFGLFLSGPHLGTEAAVKLQGSLNLAQRIVRYLVLNEVMIFTDPQGKPWDVDLKAQGITDLRPNSDALVRLNPGASGRHPQWNYKTVAGNRQGVELGLLNLIMGLNLDDGIVNIPSANFPGLGQVSSQVEPYTHLTIYNASGVLPILAGLLR